MSRLGNDSWIAYAGSNIPNFEGRVGDHGRLKTPGGFVARIWMKDATMTNLVRLSPNTPAAVICEEEVTLSRLASILEAAVIECRIDEDGDIYASDGLEFPAWIWVRQDKKMLTFFTHSTADDISEGDRFQRINNINRNIFFVQFYWHDEALWGNYSMSYDGGLNSRQFIKMLRNFSGAFASGLRFASGDDRVDS